MAKKKKKSDKDLESKWKRVLADYDNFRKRIEKEKSEFVKLANAQLLDKLLGILDHLETCQQHLKDKGLDLVCQQFQELLKSEEVEEIEALNKEFDPELMDAVEMVKGAKNKVMEIKERGYLINGRLLRPAKVKVGSGK